MTTTEYTTMKVAEAAWNADQDNMDLLDALEAAERAYVGLESVRAAEWGNLPEGEAKDSAEQNANDTEGEFDRQDRAAWYACALYSYEFLENA